jgi:hypothetical protein
VLYMQFGSSSGGASSDPPGYVPRRRPAVTPVAEAQAAKAEKKAVYSNAPPPAAAAATVDATKWKPPDVASVVEYDPFARPAIFPKPQVAEAAGGNEKDLVAAAAAEDERKRAETEAQLQRRLEELQKQGVHVIVRQHDKYIAMIGDRTVKVGDNIEGFTVTEIGPNGVRIERKAAP